MSSREVMSEAKWAQFEKRAFESATVEGREELCAELAAQLSRELLGATDFHDGVATAVSELRSLGHDLWSYDEDDEFEIWGPNYAQPSSPGVVITFRSGGPTEVTWSSVGRLH